MTQIPLANTLNTCILILWLSNVLTLSHRKKYITCQNLTPHTYHIINIYLFTDISHSVYFTFLKFLFISFSELPLQRTTDCVAQAIEICFLKFKGQKSKIKASAGLSSSKSSRSLTCRWRLLFSVSLHDLPSGVSVLKFPPLIISPVRLGPTRITSV